MGLTQASVHHEENYQSRKTVDANKQISDCYHQSIYSQESDHFNQVNENIVHKACDTVRDLAVCDDVDKNDAFTSVEQEFQGDIGASDYNASSDEQINAENQAKDVQAESIFADSSEVKDTSMLSGQELPGQHAHDNEGVNSVGKATDGNGDPSKDPDHTIDAENMTVDEPDRTLDSVEVNTVGEANDTNGHSSQEADVTVNVENSNVDEPANGDPSKDPDHMIDAEITTVDDLDCTHDSVEVNTVVEANDTTGHPSQESNVTVDVENSNIDEPDIIHDSSKTNDTNAEQIESMVDDDVEHNDVSQKVLPVQCAHDSEEVNTVDKATDVNGDPSKDSDHTIDAENMTVDEPDCILDSVEVNTVGEANDVNGHSSQEIDVQIDAENSNIDEPYIIHDSSKTNDANDEQTDESIVDDDVEQNDVSQNIIQGLQNETVSDDIEMEKADETTDASGLNT